MPNQVLLATDIHGVSPTVTVASYADGEQLGVVQKIVGTTTVNCTNRMLTLINLQVIDRDKTDIPLELFFFSAEPTVVGDKGVLDFTDADLINNWGCVSIIKCDWCHVLSRSVTNIPVQVPIQTSKDNNIWVVAKATGDGTFTRTDALSFRYYFAMDYN